MLEQIDWIIRLIYQHVLVIALASTLFLYFVLGKEEEMGKNAARNTAATVVVFFFNMVVVMKYYQAVNQWMQERYDALGIPTLPEDVWVGVPLAVTVIVGIVCKDFCDYWNHRLMHTRWGWPAHAAHHSDTHVNAFTAYRIHVFEAVIMAGSYVILLTWMQIPDAIPLVALFHAVHNMYVHLNVDIRHGPFKLLIASPYFHRWHHADTPEAYGKNLANVMPLWDWLFGTYMEPEEITQPMGLKASGVHDTNPVMILVYPVVQWEKMIRRRIKRLFRWLRAKTATPDDEALPEVYPGE